jgi:hypothetical protein
LGQGWRGIPRGGGREKERALEADEEKGGVLGVDIQNVDGTLECKR